MREYRRGVRRRTVAPVEPLAGLDALGILHRYHEGALRSLCMRRRVEALAAGAGAQLVCPACSQLAQAHALIGDVQP